ncbi:hypothetical protein PIB30_098394 [Stylosanthes scabra]|uniref:Uncharacterized protein n=1 Tax=Stylosanthes scabra TaxID=79078 RepID=A0ABU6TW29_9FABA|nr:hypothetical protein [Stylosanthes scabra]
MVRTKLTGKRTRVNPDAPPAPPRLSQMPVESWFEEDDQITAYQERISRMEILVPKYLAEDVLPEAEFQEFWRLIDIQGLRQFISLRERYYPRFVAAAYTTISIFDTLRADGTGDFRFRFKLGGREYILTLQHLADIWGLQNEGATFKSGNNPHGTWDEFDKLEAARFLNLGPAASGKYPISRMSITHRLLLYMVSYVLLPRKSNHGTATEEDLPILWAMAQEKQINWPYLIAHKMVKYSRGAATASLGLAHLWTRILESLDFDLTRERVIEPSKVNAITHKNINQMRRNLLGPADEGGDDEDEAMEDVPPTFEAGTSSQVPTEAEAPSPLQPDYAELIQRGFDDMRTLMSEGFSSLSDRMDRLDIRITNQSVEIQDLRGEFRSFRDSFQRSGHQEQQDPAPGQD